MHGQMIMWYYFMQCNDGFGKYWSQEAYCKKSDSNWSFGSKVMACWTSMYTLQSLDHNFSTTHQMLMILNFLKRGVKDLQLSCWPKFKLKLLWCWKVKLNMVQNLPFLETWKLEVIFHFWKLLIWLQILQGRCLTCWITFFGTWMKCLNPFLHLLALS